MNCSLLIKNNNIATQSFLDNPDELMLDTSSHIRSYTSPLSVRLNRLLHVCHCQLCSAKLVLFSAVCLSVHVCLSACLSVYVCVCLSVQELKHS